MAIKIAGIKEQIARFKRLEPVLSKDAREAMLKAANLVMMEAKTNRFRSISGANKKIKGKYVIKPIPGILTRRSGVYLSRITNPIEVGRGRFMIAARVPYARRHEDSRPVLTKALKNKEAEIEKIIETKIFTEIDKDNG